QTVFHFTDANQMSAASDFTAVVTLGDGNSVTLGADGVVGDGPPRADGQIVATGDGGFDVQLAYAYAEVLTNQTFGVQVTDTANASTNASISNFSVTEAPLTAGVVSPPHGSTSSTPTTFVGTGKGLSQPTDSAYYGGFLYVPNADINTISKVSL